MNVIYRVNKGFKVFLCYFYQVLMGNIIFSTHTRIIDVPTTCNQSHRIFIWCWGFYFYRNLIVVFFWWTKTFWLHSRDTMDMWHLCCCFICCCIGDHLKSDRTLKWRTIMQIILMHANFGCCTCLVFDFAKMFLTLNTM